MTLQNSINAPSPFAVNKGGTGNSTALTNGQLWVGNTGNAPSISTITAGSNISVTNGAGSITIATTGPASLDWNFNVSGAPTIFVMADFNGYTTQQSGIIFRTPTTAVLGAIYKIQAYWISVPGTGFQIQRQSTQSFQLNGSAGTTLTTTNPNASIELMCSSGNGVSAIFTVISTNGATFVLT